MCRLHRVRDFSPIADARLLLNTNTVVIHPSVPAKTVKKFIHYAKANPGKIAYASGRSGFDEPSLRAPYLKKMTGVQMVHVPYRGGAPAVADTVERPDAALLRVAGMQSSPHVNAGKLRLLAVTESRRSSLLPDVPTVAESIPGYEMAVWYGAFGLAGMPPAIRSRSSTPRSAAFGLVPDVKKRMDDIAVEVAKIDARGIRRPHPRRCREAGASSSRS